MADSPAGQARSQGWAVAQLLFKGRAPVPKQVVTDVGSGREREAKPWIGCIRRAGRQRIMHRLRQANGSVGNSVFTLIDGQGQFFDLFAIVVACGSVHGRVDAGRIAAQRTFDEADAFKEVAPVVGGDGAQAGKAIADNLVGAGGVGQRQGRRQRGQGGRLRWRRRRCQIGGGLRQCLQAAEPQHDRQGPQFAGSQRAPLLEDGDEAPHLLHVQASIAG